VLSAFKDLMTRGSCNSHCVSQFAAFFLDVGTEISTVENFQLDFVFKFFQVGRSRPRCISGDNDPSAGSPTEQFWKCSKPEGFGRFLPDAISCARIAPTAPVSR